MTVQSSSRLLVALVLAFCLAGCMRERTPLSSEDNKAWIQANLDRVMEKKTFSASNGMQMPYRLFIPSDYTGETAYPLVVFLHGRGQRGTQNESKIFDDVALFTDDNSIVSPNGQHRFPSIVLVPQCSDHSPDQEWAHWVGNSPEKPFAGLGKDGSYQQHEEPSSSGAAALELIEATIKNYAIDPNRVYITGVSMGGFGTWEFTTRRPDLFAAAVPMAGYSDPSKADKIKDIPFWIFHGDQDEYNPVEGSRIMAQRLESLGAEVKYTEYAGVKHGETFEKAWKNPEILPWMFSKTKE